MDWFKANDFPVAPHLPTSKRLVDFYGFAIRRQERFLARVNGSALVSEDPILDKWKFTNAYRILDRVSQYMAKNIIDDRANRFEFPRAHRMGMFLFRLFNSIETWESLPEYKYDAYNALPAIKSFVEARRACGVTVYNNAYMMTPPWTFGCTTRTELFLRTLKHMEDSGDLERAYNSSDMRYTYAIFRRHEGFGDFLAYQFALDFSYNHLMFDYEKFIVPGIGCQRGMRRVWPHLKLIELPSVLKRLTINGIPSFPVLTVDGKEFPIRGNDMQNLFCEYDKYCRVRDDGKSIKSNFSRILSPLEQPYIPSAWRF